MAIQVLCPGCKKRFQVSDQFAGKTGPCPSCKTPIKIPEPTGEVKVHEPEPSGGRGRSGRLILKPVSHTSARFSWKAALGIGGVVVAVFVAALLGRRWDEPVQSIWWWGVLILVSPPLVTAAYSVLYDDELEPYRGRWLWIRSAIAATVYAALWGGLVYVMGHYYTGELWNWLIILPSLAVVGALAAHAALDLDLGNAAVHYAFYLLATVALRWAAGFDWLWNHPAAV
jgi:hypothetical protein